MQTEQIPVPPDDVALYGTGKQGEAYLEQGRRVYRCIRHCLPPDIVLAGRRVLDFGCGSGRVLRYFAEFSGETEFWGCDISDRCIDWLRKHFPPEFRFIRNTEMPGLPFESDYFDLVLCVSVFTHLTDTWEQWLRELRRVLKPGGVALISFLNRVAYETNQGNAFVEEKIGLEITLREQGWEAGGPSVYHSNWWILQNWSRILTVEAIVREGLESFQSVAVCRKTAGGGMQDRPLTVQPFPYCPVRPDFKGSIDLDPFAGGNWLSRPGIPLTPVSRLSGWFVSARGRLVGVEARVAGEKVPVEAKVGVERADVGRTFPGFPESLRSGFELLLDLTSVPRDRACELEVVGIDAAGDRLPITAHVRIDGDA